MDGSEECKTKHITKQPQAGTTWMAVTTFEKNDAYVFCVPAFPVLHIVSCACVIRLFMQGD
jgi:hypothetical protein